MAEDSLKLISINGRYKVSNLSNHNKDEDILIIRYGGYSYQAILDKEGNQDSEVGRNFSSTFEAPSYADISINILLKVTTATDTRILKYPSVISPQNFLDGIITFDEVIDFDYSTLENVSGCSDPMSTTGNFDDCVTVDDNTCSYTITNQCKDITACHHCDDVGCYNQCSHCDNDEEWKCFVDGLFYNPNDDAVGNGNCVYPEQPVRIGFIEPSTDVIGATPTIEGDVYERFYLNPNDIPPGAGLNQSTMSELLNLPTTSACVGTYNSNPDKKIDWDDDGYQDEFCGELTEEQCGTGNSAGECTWRNDVHYGIRGLGAQADLFCEQIGYVSKSSSEPSSRVGTYYPYVKYENNEWVKYEVGEMTNGLYIWKNFHCQRIGDVPDPEYIESNRVFLDLNGDLSYYFNENNFFHNPNGWDCSPFDSECWNTRPPIDIYINVDVPITSFIFDIDKVVLNGTNLPITKDADGNIQDYGITFVILNNDDGSSTIRGDFSSEFSGYFILSFADNGNESIGSYDDIIQLRNCLTNISFLNGNDLVEPVYYDKSCIEVNKYNTYEDSQSGTEVEIQGGSGNNLTNRLSILRQLGGKRYTQTLNLHRGENVVSFWNLRAWYFGSRMNSVDNIFPANDYLYIDRISDNCGSWYHSADNPGWETEPDRADSTCTQEHQFFGGDVGEGILFGKLMAGLSYTLTICYENIFDDDDNPKYSYNGICFEETTTTTSSAICESGYRYNQDPINLGDGNYWCPGDIITNWEIKIDENTLPASDDMCLSTDGQPCTGVIPNEFYQFTNKYYNDEQLISCGGPDGSVNYRNIPCSEVQSYQLCNGDCVAEFETTDEIRIFESSFGGAGLLLNTMSQGAFSQINENNYSLKMGIIPQCKEDIYSPISTILAYKNIPLPILPLNEDGSPTWENQEQLTGIQADNYSIIEYETELMTQSDNDGDGELDTWLGTLTQQEIGQGYNMRLTTDYETDMDSYGNVFPINWVSKPTAGSLIGYSIGRWVNEGYDECGICSGDARFHIINSDKDDSDKCCLYPYEKQTWYEQMDDIPIGRIWADRLVLCETTESPYTTEDGRVYWPEKDSSFCEINEYQDCSGKCFVSEADTYFSNYDKFGNCCYKGNIDICGICNGDGSICEDTEQSGFFGIEEFCDFEGQEAVINGVSISPDGGNTDGHESSPYEPVNLGQFQIGFQTPITLHSIEFKVNNLSVYDSEHTLDSSYEMISSFFYNDDGTTSIILSSTNPYIVIDSDTIIGVNVHYDNVLSNTVTLSEVTMYYLNGESNTYSVNQSVTGVTIYGCSDENSLNYNPICQTNTCNNNGENCNFSETDCMGVECHPDNTQCPDFSGNASDYLRPDLNAFINTCGVCVGGSSSNDVFVDYDIFPIGSDGGEDLSLENGQDCNADCFGSAYVNECGYCVGGGAASPYVDFPSNTDPSTGNIKPIQVLRGQDCNRDCAPQTCPQANTESDNVSGCAYLNTCNVCVSGDTTRTDDNYYSGFKNPDNGDDLVDYTYQHGQDCNLDCFGDAIKDECDVCTGGGTSYEYQIPSFFKDCADVCWGDSYEDPCGVCDNDPSNDGENQDCGCGTPGTLGKKHYFFDQDGDGIVNCGNENPSPEVLSCTAPDNSGLWIECGWDDGCVEDAVCKTDEPDNCTSNYYDDCGICVPYEDHDGDGDPISETDYLAWPDFNESCTGCNNPDAENYDDNAVDCDPSDGAENDSCCIYPLDYLEENVDYYLAADVSTGALDDEENLDEYLMNNYEDTVLGYLPNLVEHALDTYTTTEGTGEVPITADDIDNLDEWLMYNYGPDAGSDSDLVETYLPLLLSQYGSDKFGVTVPLRGYAYSDGTGASPNEYYYMIYYPFEEDNLSISIKDLGNYLYNVDPDEYYTENCEPTNISWRDCDIPKTHSNGSMAPYDGFQGLSKNGFRVIGYTTNGVDWNFSSYDPDDSDVGNAPNEACNETDGSCISKGFIMILTLFPSDERDILLDETSGICVNDECDGGIYDGQPCSDTDTCDGVISWLKFK